MKLRLGGYLYRRFLISYFQRYTTNGLRVTASGIFQNAQSNPLFDSYYIKMWPVTYINMYIIGILIDRKKIINENILKIFKITTFF